MSLSQTLTSLLASGLLCPHCAARYFLRIGDAFYQQTPAQIAAALLAPDAPAPPPPACVACANVTPLLSSPATRPLVLAALASSGHDPADAVSFSFTLPHAVAAREHVLTAHLRALHGLRAFEPLRLKDALRAVLAAAVPWPHRPDAPLRVCVAYRHPQLAAEEDALLAAAARRRRRGEDALTAASVARLLDQLAPERVAEVFGVPPRRVAGEGELRVGVERDRCYVAGRYRKYTRQLSQTRWVVPGKPGHERSIESEVCGAVRAAFRCDATTLVASGREDVDVRMLGNGRPFVVEVTNARHAVLGAAELEGLQRAINASPAVQVMHLQQVTAADAAAIHEGERAKRKRYLAVIWATAMRDVAMENVVVAQKTPIRVMHRRTLMTRQRTVHTLRICRDTAQYGVLYAETEAGTYVKEFVHGDLGRTTPSVCEILGCDCDILSLDVVGVCLDFPPACRDEAQREVDFDVPPFVSLGKTARAFCERCLAGEID